jgi:anti-sigma factor RsiW
MGTPTMEHTMELLQAELDGELDAHSRAELARLLLADSKVRALREGLRNLGGQLDALGHAEPPADLKDAVMRSLPAASPASVAARPEPSRQLWRAGSWRYAAALAGVIVAGAAVVRLAGGQFGPESEMAGTLAAQRAELPAVATLSGATAPLGTASLARDAAGLRLTVDLAPGTPLDLRVADHEHSLAINGLGQGRTVLRLPGLGDAGQPIELRFLAKGQEVARARLQLAAPGNTQ